ncbi:MAG: glycine cleavage system aminomethyltransferase GcvT [Chloroflexi bacterium]|nr:glycine cleavage system aminomethyltransferase GcvT [Chloroflexota bacterium]
MTPDADARLLRTPLYQVHLDAGARMVPFGGWDMPVQYTGIIAEHLAVRASVGLFDLSHMGRLRFCGSNGRATVQELTTNDVGRLSDGRAQYSLICNEQGGIRDDVVVYNRGDDLLMVVNASNREKILGWISERLGSKALPEDLTSGTAMIGVQGPAAEALLQPMTDTPLASLRYYSAVDGVVAGTRALIARTGYTGEDGFELIIDAAIAPSLWHCLADGELGPKPALCGLGARDTLRLEAGMPLYGHELDEATTPFEAGLTRVVRLDKAAFVGRAALARLSEAPPARRLVGFEMLGSGVPRQGYPVAVEGEAAGVVTSGTHSPSLRRSIGIALVRTAFAVPGQAIAVVVREKPQSARVVDLPHVPHHTRKIPARQS